MSTRRDTVPDVLVKEGFTPPVGVITVPVLSRDGVTLRLHTPADVADALACHADPLGKTWATLPTASTTEAYGRWLATVGASPTPRLVTLAIEVEGRFAGQAGLRADGDQGGVVFFITSPWVRGRGVAAIASSLLVEYALTTLGWEFVSWQAHVGNVGSAKTAWRSGFPPAVVLSPGLPLRGRVVDAWHSTLTRPAQRPAGPWEDFLP